MAIIAARIAAACWAAKREVAASGTPRAMLQPPSAASSATHSHWPAIRGHNKNRRNTMLPPRGQQYRSLLLCATRYRSGGGEQTKNYNLQCFAPVLSDFILGI